MDASIPVRSTRYGLFSVALILVAGTCVGLRYFHDRHAKDDIANFALTYDAPSGWQPVPHGPQTLFLYQQPQSRILLRGAVNQMVADFNPTPDLGTDSLAKEMVDNTLANMPGWSAQTLDTVSGHGADFRLVRRSQKGQVVITAFAVKGNTTVLISLSGRDNHVSDVDKDMTEFRSFLSNVKLSQADLSKL